MKKQQFWIERMRGIERQDLAAAAAVDLLQETLSADPSFGANAGWKQSDARILSDELDKTFLVRLYALFESGLRDYWKSERKKNTRPIMKDLLTSAAANSAISQAWLNAAIEVQLFRNRIVHEDDGRASNDLTIQAATSALCRFFSKLPLHWK
jgi:hypothetical protein